jgi:hypothetical protein
VVPSGAGRRRPVIRRLGTSLVLLCVLHGGAALCDEPWVDDEGVLSARHLRLQAGLGMGLLSVDRLNGQTYYSGGGGLNLEGAVGVGASIEVGARVGHRVVAAGSGMRGDEIARLDDTETYGTGLDNFPNPEFRVRWRAYRWRWGEAGLEDRFVPPVEAEREAAEVIGAWTSLHMWRRARLDVGFNGVLTWHWFAGGTVLEPGFGVPVRLWANFTQALYIGLITAPHYSGSTPFTSEHSELLMGVGVGYRIRRCDTMAVMSSRNALEGLLTRVGLGIGVACRI